MLFLCTFIQTLSSIHISYSHYSAVQDDADFLQRAVEGNLVVEDFDSLKNAIDKIYNECSEIKGGKVSVIINLN